MQKDDSGAQDVGGFYRPTCYSNACTLIDLPEVLDATKVRCKTALDIYFDAARGRCGNLVVRACCHAAGIG